VSHNTKPRDFDTSPTMKASYALNTYIGEKAEGLSKTKFHSESVCLIVKVLWSSRKSKLVHPSKSTGI